jgi:hypothetical protein
LKTSSLYEYFDRRRSQKNQKGNRKFYFSNAGEMNCHTRMLKWNNNGKNRWDISISLALLCCLCLCLSLSSISRISIERIYWYLKRCFVLYHESIKTSRSSRFNYAIAFFSSFVFLCVERHSCEYKYDCARASESECERETERVTFVDIQISFLVYIVE